MSKHGKICLILLTVLALGMFFSKNAVSGENKGLTLDRAYGVALEENENIRISRQDLSIAESDIASATSNLYPQISARGAYTRQKDIRASSAPEKYGTMSLQLDQHIYQWGKVWSGREMAKYYYEGSRFRHIRRVQEILYQVGVRYYEALLGRRSIEIAENSLERATRQAEQARARFEAGVVTKTDVLRAEVQVARSREDLERAKNQYDIAREQLALEMGVESLPGKLVEPEERSFKKTSISDLYEKAISNRQDLLQAEKQLRGAEQRVDFEQADFFPNISLTGEYTRTDEKTLFYGESEDWQASLVLSYPLFTGWNNSSEVAKAKSEKRQAKYSLARLRKQIQNEVRSVYLDIQTQLKVIEQLEQQVRSAKRNYAQISAQFKEGMVTAVDQIDAFTALNEAENRLAQAYYTYQLDLLRLKLTTGTFKNDLLEKEILNEKG
ncbi:MAG: TolC family protein [Desulfobacteraceae bacterium]|nr:TolC family protein [Desulfobacteraceae bacterium]MCF8094615.1 TolC family protein [Desulfobacteraceae bacterium]